MGTDPLLRGRLGAIVVQNGQLIHLLLFDGRTISSEARRRYGAGLTRMKIVDGDFPGPKGLRAKILDAFRQSARHQPIMPEPVPEQARPTAPAPGLRPPGMSGPRPTRQLPSEPDMAISIQQYERRSFYEDLRARVRGEVREGKSLLRHDFDREKD